MNLIYKLCCSVENIENRELFIENLKKIISNEEPNKTLLVEETKEELPNIYQNKFNLIEDTTIIKDKLKKLNEYYEYLSYLKSGEESNMLSISHILEIITNKQGLNIFNIKLYIPDLKSYFLINIKMNEQLLYIKSIKYQIEYNIACNKLKAYQKDYEYCQSNIIKLFNENPEQNSKENSIKLQTTDTCTKYINSSEHLHNSTKSTTEDCQSNIPKLFNENPEQNSKENSIKLQTTDTCTKYINSSENLQNSTKSTNRSSSSSSDD